MHFLRLPGKLGRGRASMVLDFGAVVEKLLHGRSMCLGMGGVLMHWHI